MNISKYKLSVVIPAAPGRFDRVQSLLERFTLNKEKHSEISFELILIDDSLNQQYLIICKELSQTLNIKYINIPLNIDYPNPAYMRNCGFRIAEGKVFCLCDVDWFVSENFISGAVKEIQKRKVLNTGYMIDTSKGFDGSIAGAPTVNENHPLITQLIMFNQWAMRNATKLEIAEVYKVGNIPPPKEGNAVWLWSVDRDSFLSINGYDEFYCYGKYSREDDDLYIRLQSLLPTYKSDFADFCGVHLFHQQPARGDKRNQINRDYFNKVCNPVKNIKRNLRHEWGKLTQDSFSIINGANKTFNSHELWINEKIGLPIYKKSWSGFGELIESVKC